MPKEEVKKNEEEETTSWADGIAEEVIKRKKKEFVFEGMWTPSGYFHIGNSRPEIFTPYSVKKATEDKGFKCRQNFILDDFDAVRKIPSGLGIKEEDHDKYIGFPCATAPSPLPGFDSWADCFVSQVKKVIGEFGVELNIISAYDTYKEGKLNDLIKFALEHASELTKVWNDVAGTDKPLDFVPLQVLCEKCKKIYFTTVTGWNKEKELVSYDCKCGHKAEVSPYNGNAKLHWRVHWASHWILHEVDFESGGKDHFSKGGSVDVGRAMMERVFKQTPPVQTPTEFLQIGGAKMAGSVGNVIDLEAWLKVAQPEMFRFLNFSYKPNSVIEFSFKDNSFILLNERYERAEKIFYGLEEAINKADEKQIRAYELSMIKPKAKRLVQVYFTQCVMLAQLMDPAKELDNIISVLQEMEMVPKDLSKEEKEAIQAKMKRAKFWAENYAPEQFKISFLETVSEETKKALSVEIKEAFKLIADGLAKAKTADDIQQLVFESGRSKDVKPKEMFRALYLVLLGRERGPKIGSLALAFGREKVAARLQELA